jgi:PAS domain S-box-containing protein
MWSKRTLQEPQHQALLITLVYTAVGTAWILGSDYVAMLIAGEAATLALAQRIKGLIYIALTASGLFVLIRRALIALRTVEREKQAHLRERDELARYLESIIEAAPVAILDLDTEARVKSLWNPTAERVFGYTKDDAIGAPTRIISQEDWKRLAPSIEQVQKGGSVEQIEVELIRRNGTRFPAIVAAAPLPGFADRGTVVIITDITDFKAAMTQLEVAFQERDVLLQELHHRVKNNLQIISSLLMMEHESIETDDVASNSRHRLERAMRRVRAIAHLHERLYFRGHFAQIELSDYIGYLCSEIAINRDPKAVVDLTLELESLRVDMDTAAPLGLITYELVTNAYDHGGKNNVMTQVKVSLTASTTGISLSIWDNGDGMIPTGPPPRVESGLSLVRALSAQLGATVKLTQRDGPLIVVSVPRTSSKGQ